MKKFWIPIAVLAILASQFGIALAVNGWLAETGPAGPDGEPGIAGPRGTQGPRGDAGRNATRGSSSTDVQRRINDVMGTDASLDDMIRDAVEDALQLDRLLNP